MLRRSTGKAGTPALSETRFNKTRHSTQEDLTLEAPPLGEPLDMALLSENVQNIAAKPWGL
jgi:hypothetical protein